MGLPPIPSVPPAPKFGLVLSPTTGGVLDLGAIAFGTLVNTVSIIAGTYSFHYYDEINGVAPFTLTAPIAAADTSIAFGETFAAGMLLQIEQEIVQVTGTNPDTSSIVTRGAQGTPAADHAIPALAYQLSENVADRSVHQELLRQSGQRRLAVQRRASERSTRQRRTLHDQRAGRWGRLAVNSYTATIDSGLRTLGGGQYSFQITGYLAIQTTAAPVVIVDSDRSVRDIYGIVGTAPTGAAIVLQINRNGAAYASVQIRRRSNDLECLRRLRAARICARAISLSLNITGVGTTVPGSDLTFVMRL